MSNEYSMDSSPLYTVVRFDGRAAKVNVGNIATHLSRFLPEACDEPPHEPQLFSCSISTSASWSQHRNAVLQFISSCKPVLLKMRGDGVSIVFDVAVYTAQTSDMSITSLTLDTCLIESLNDIGALFEVSVYNT